MGARFHDVFFLIDLWLHRRLDVPVAREASNGLDIRRLRPCRDRGSPEVMERDGRLALVVEKRRRRCGCPPHDLRETPVNGGGDEPFFAPGSPLLGAANELYPGRAHEHVHPAVNGRVTQVTDAAGKSVFYEYDGPTGRLDAVKNHLNKYTRYECNARGQVLHVWRDVPQPVEIGYDATYGERTTLKMFRGGTGWEGPGWPASPGTADTTTWAYHTATGLRLKYRAMSSPNCSTDA